MDDSHWISATVGDGQVIAPGATHVSPSLPACATHPKRGGSGHMSTQRPTVNGWNQVPIEAIGPHRAIDDV